jgi:hypothetical protein
MDMKSIKARRIFVALMMAVFMAALMAATAFADTSDPYLNAYDGDLYMPVRTYILDSGDVTQVFYISPSAIPAPDAPPSFFDSESDALAVSFDIILDSAPSMSLSGASISDKVAYEFDTDQWFLEVEVTIANDSSFGSLSVKATNPGAVPVDDAYTNVTIARQEATPWQYTSVNSVEVRIYDPASTDYYGATGMTVANTDFYEDPDLMSFPTGLDGLYHAYYYGGIRDNVQNITTQFLSGTGTYVYSMTINGATYAIREGSTGWQYRVYDVRHFMVPLYEFVFADAIKLQLGDIIVWKYGSFDDPDLFPSYLP